MVKAILAVLVIVLGAIGLHSLADRIDTAKQKPISLAGEGQSSHNGRGVKRS